MRKLPNLLACFLYNFEEINLWEFKILEGADQNTPGDIKHMVEVCHDNSPVGSFREGTGGSALPIYGYFPA